MTIKNAPDPDYEPSTDFSSFTDGSYEINGISWITNDDSGAPIFVASKGWAPLVARYRSVMADGSDGPPGSVSPGEVAMLVRVFGADPSKLPDRDADPTAFLIAARDMINSTGKVLKVTVKDGWVNHIPGMGLPVDKYFTFELDALAPREDDVPTQREGQYGPWFIVNLRVVGDLQQRPTVYDGYRCASFVNYGLIVNEQGELEYESRETKSGAKDWTSAAVRLHKVIVAFAPTLETDEIAFASVNNILPELEQEALRLRRRAVGQVTKDSKGRIGVKIESLAAIDPDLPPMPAPEPEKELPARDVEDEVVEPPSMEQVYAVIGNLCTEKAFDASGNLTTAGKNWCREHLKPFLKEKGYPAKLSEWTESIRTDILDFLNPSGSDDEF